jgi:hypothetical protein
MKSAIRTTVMAVGFLVGTMGAQANLVQNSDFESGGKGRNIPNWTIINPKGNGAGVNNSPYVPFTSPTGGNSFHMEKWTGGYSHIADIGGIRQTIAGLTVGNTYQLSFWSTGTDWLVPDEYNFWQVTFGSEVKDGTHVTPYEDHYLYNVDGTDAGTGNKFIAAQPWVYNTLEFIAGATSQVLQFSQVNFMPNHAPHATPSLLFLDGIDLTDITTNNVPEPSSVGLITLGLLGAAFATRQRKKKMAQ